MDLIPGTFSHGFNEDLLNWFGSECGRTGSMLELTMQVGATLDTVTQDMYDALATSITKINTGYGVPVYLRFCHEMNGDWTMYGYQPTLFKAGFRKMAEAIRARTNMTAMVWGPNVGITYPFTGGGSVLLPRKGTPDFIAMDTNKDGEITNLDDPYSPYYPGDDVVDWVGVSLYNYPLDNCYNCRVLPTYFADYLTGEGAALEGVTTVTPAYTEVHNFYQKYCAGPPNKPMMLPESGSPFITERVARANAQSVSESELKMQWWEQLVSAENLAKFPKFKLAVQFEEAKMMSPTGVPELFNWKVTNTTQVLSAFNALLDRSASTIVSAGKLKFGCDGRKASGTVNCRAMRSCQQYHERLDGFCKDQNRRDTTAQRISAAAANSEVHSPIPKIGLKAAGKAGTHAKDQLVKAVQDAGVSFSESGILSGTNLKGVGSTSARVVEMDAQVSILKMEKEA
ncbi:hypothetical protein HDU78_011176 [Chytriomyces hyalinus]|nr:hypothetical protein HDU78_011176 [Chytriomyces hyalinus]